MSDSSLYNWLTDRTAGVLLHPTSFPGDQGIGSLGKEARRFLDFMKAAGLSCWQVCPLGPTGFGDSPYQSFSAFAGNPYLIDLHQLVAAKLLQPADLVALQVLPSDHVDYGQLYQRFWPILRTAWERFRDNRRLASDFGDFEAFKKEEQAWLYPYALFMALKDANKGKSWLEWPAKVRSLAAAEKSGAAKGLEEAIEAQQFYQFLFFSQWKAVRKLAQERGIQIIGDVPIFVALDSADVWAHPEFFQLDKSGKPTAVAGVPPDYFSPKGQLWGNPLFDWKALKADGYQWWLKRIESAEKLYDIVRIDHFRGFDSYWSVPAGSKDATKGTWEDGPGLDFFKVLHQKKPDLKLVAEDLGIITDRVRKLLKDSGLPGMSVLQFAYGGDADNNHLPHNALQNMAIYTGTHDNDTTSGWYASTNEATRHHLRMYHRVSGEDANWDLIRAAYASTARLAIVPMQDFLNLGTEARFNTPGSTMGNWQWRYETAQIDQLWRASSGYLCEQARLYGRI